LLSHHLIHHHVRHCPRQISPRCPPRLPQEGTYAHPAEFASNLGHTRGYITTSPSPFSPSTPKTPSLPLTPQGITFLDIFPVLRDPFAFETLITHFVHHITTKHAGARPDVIVGLDARGFLFGPIIAQRLGAAFVPVRKGGKLPGQVNVAKYEKEYGVDEFEMQAGAIQPGQKCIVVE
jgi:hypothetical protein